MNLSCATCVWVVALFLTSSTTSRATDYDLYLLAGQSNMDGYGYNRDLPGNLQKPQPGVMIFHGDSASDGDLKGGRGLWETLQPGHGVGFTSDGKENHLSDRFGVELSFAARMAELRPDRKFAIIKYSRGGTSIDVEARGGAGCWDPDFDLGEGGGENAGGARGINQYDHCLTTIRNACAQRDIDGDGKDDRLIPAGIVWMQGESDAAYTPEIASRYFQNLSKVMNVLCAAMRVDDLPIAIGRISDSGQGKDGKVWKHGEIVRKAEADYAQQHRNAEIVTSTDGYKYSDAAHYDSAGFIDLGREFAEAIQRAAKASDWTARVRLLTKGSLVPLMDQIAIRELNIVPLAEADRSKLSKQMARLKQYQEKIKDNRPVHFRVFTGNWQGAVRERLDAGDIHVGMTLKALEALLGPSARTPSVDGRDATYRWYFDTMMHVNPGFCVTVADGHVQSFHFTTN